MPRRFSNICEAVTDDAVKNVDVADLVILNHVFEHNRVVHRVKVVERGFPVEVEVFQRRETAELHKVLEAFAQCAVALAVQLDKFRKRKRLDQELNVATGKMCGEITGKHARIRPGDIDICVIVDADRVDGFLPVGDLLNFVKEEIRAGV